MRLPANQRLILSLLSVHGPSFGLQLVAASGGRLKRGGIYVTLGGMAQKGLVGSEVGDEGRRLYRLTGLGYRALAAIELVGTELERGHSA